ncbi:MAG: hypothetical protein M3Y84_13495, partial [Acidobacteriota bacterium]|nr:hypothetical protein [Acidobacteriota bacterium]
MIKFLVFVMVIMCAAVTVSAQTPNDVKHTPAVTEAIEQHPDLSRAEQDERDVSSRRISYEYVAPTSRKIGVVRVGAPTTYLKRGLTMEEVIHVLGQPADISQRLEEGVLVTTYEFRRGGERMLIAEFVHDRLVRSRTENR